MSKESSGYSDLSEVAADTKNFRITAVHNLYSSKVPSGENQAFWAETQLLRDMGHPLNLFLRNSDDIHKKGIVGIIKSAFLVPWNHSAANKLKRQVEDFDARIVHFHNTFPLISPSGFHAIGKGTVRVMTLHNYRIFCPAAIPMRGGKVCTECIDQRSSIPAVVYGCYRRSRVATLPLALSVGLHRKLETWTKQVDAFICLSEFQRKLVIEAGLPGEKVYVKPNFFPGNPNVVAWSKRKPYVVFAGRLTAEKGLLSLIHAWQAWGPEAPELRLVGDGELKAELVHKAEGLPVRFLGQVSSEEAQAQIANARLLVLPSECFEGFPMVVREAFAFGTPAAVSDLGPLPGIVEHNKSGIVFQPGSPESLLREVRTAWEIPGLLERLGQGARLEFQSKYTEEANYSTLMEIYRKAIDGSRSAER